MKKRLSIIGALILSLFKSVAMTVQALAILVASILIIAAAVYWIFMIGIGELQGWWLDQQLRNMPKHHPKIRYTATSPVSPSVFQFETLSPDAEISHISIIYSPDIQRPVTNWLTIMDMTILFDETGTNAIGTNYLDCSAACASMVESNAVFQRGFFRSVVWTNTPTP